VESILTSTDAPSARPPSLRCLDAVSLPQWPVPLQETCAENLFKSTGIERQGSEELLWRTSSNSGVLARPSKNHVKNHQERSRGYRSTMACGLPRAGANKTGLTRDKRDTDLIHEAGGCPRFIFAAGVILSCQCCQSSCDENPKYDMFVRSCRLIATYYTHSTVYNVLKFKQEGIKLIKSFKTNSRLIN